MNKKLLFPLVLAGCAAVYASRNPDGLDKVSEMLGFAGKGTQHAAVMSGYVVGFLGTSKFSAVCASIAGALIVYGIFLLASAIMKKIFLQKQAE